MTKKLKNTILLATIIIVLNFVSQHFYKRFDLTSDKRFTLSNNTKNILSPINKSVYITVYLEGDFPSEFKRLQVETRQFLEELSAENSNIKIQFENPEDRREELIKKGMMPSQLTVQEEGKLSKAIIFPWAEINFEEKTNLVSLFPNAIAVSQDQQLEKAIENLDYSFINAIHSILEKKNKKIAIIVGNGELQDIFQYSYLSEVAKKYKMAKFTLDSVATNAPQTLQDLTTFDLAIIAKPTEQFTENEKFVIDQFITNGGKTLWMIDNVQADQDSLYNGGKMLAYPRDLNLTDLLFSYGIRINNSLIKDLYSAKIPLATGNIGNQPQFQNFDWFFHPLVNGNPNHAITKNLIPIRLQFANQIDILKNNIKKTALLQSSILTKKVGTPTIIDLQSIAEKPQEIDYKDGNQLFAVLLEGNFNSGYKNRIKPFKTPLFRENSMNNKMIVIADGDIGKNQVLKGKPCDLARDKWTNQEFGNKDFLLNSIDYLLDDVGLMQLRNKTIKIAKLDQQKAHRDKAFWQFFNMILPLILLFFFGIVFNYLRRKRFG
jgi:ABC-2 type transport system permease protein